VTDDAGNTIFSHSVEAGDIWRMCQTKDAPIKVSIIVLICLFLLNGLNLSSPTFFVTTRMTPVTEFKEFERRFKFKPGFGRFKPRLKFFKLHLRKGFLTFKFLRSL